MYQESYGIVTTHIAPARGYGGPAVSVAELAHAWARSGHSIILCTSDASMGGRLVVEDLAFHRRVSVRLYRAYWAKRWGFGLGALKQIFSVCRQAKAVYVNGIATWPTTVGALCCALLGRRYVVAVRGGLMPRHASDIRATKPWKWLYYRIVSIPTLRRAAAIHCASEQEANGIQELIGSGSKCVIAGNGVNLQTTPLLMSPTESNLTLCYVGRISQEKGLNEFVRIWSRLRAAKDRLIVLGVGEGEYFLEFLRMEQSENSGIDYRGYVGIDGVWQALAGSHFLVLPTGLGTRGPCESFGNSVAQALGAGRPVMVSRGLSWDHIEIEGAGIVFDGNFEAVRAAIERARSTSAAVWARMAVAARAYAERELDIQVTAERVMSALQPASTPNVSAAPRSERRGQK